MSWVVKCDGRVSCMFVHPEHKLWGYVALLCFQNMGRILHHFHPEPSTLQTKETLFISWVILQPIIRKRWNPRDWIWRSAACCVLMGLFSCRLLILTGIITHLPTMIAATCWDCSKSSENTHRCSPSTSIFVRTFMHVPQLFTWTLNVAYKPRPQPNSNQSLKYMTSCDQQKCPFFASETLHTALNTHTHAHTHTPVQPAGLPQLPLPLLNTSQVWCR